MSLSLRYSFSFKGMYMSLSLRYDSSAEVPYLQSVSIVKEFLEVFPNDIPRVAPEIEIDFGIDINSRYSSYLYSAK